MWLPLLFLAGGGALLFVALSGGDRDVPEHEPDLPVQPGSTRYKLVDAILGELRKASASSGIPLGLLVGWIAKESGGKIGETTKYGEVGLFQLMPSEYKKLGLDPEKLSTDVAYSINGGLAFIGVYMGDADKLGIAPKGSTYYWKLVKLLHSMGTGAVGKIVAMAQADGATGTWSRLEDYALAHDSEILHATKHSPNKWFPFVDEVAAVGAPFGFGAQATVVGGAVFADIVDPLDVLDRM
jgi:hypothetical protein